MKPRVSRASRGDKRRGHAQSSKVPFIASGAVGKRPWPLASAILSWRISRCKISPGSHDRRRIKLSRMDHHVKPGPLTKLPEDDVRRDAISRLAELTKESQLNSQLVLELWTLCQRASWSPDLTPMRGHGPANCIKQAPHHGKRLAAHERLAFGTQIRCCTFAMLPQLCRSQQHAAQHATCQKVCR